MKQLRDYGIYNLPGAIRGLYLVQDEEDTYFLYDCQFGSRLPPRFRIASNGHIINWFDDFPVWNVDDLIDTGETYETPVFSGSANSNTAKSEILSYDEKK